VRSVDDVRGGFGERFVTPWNERVKLVEDDDAWRGGPRSLSPAYRNQNQINISYFDFRDGTRKSAHVVE
jgi:hypothetical protein